MQNTSTRTLVVLLAQSGPLITRRLDQLPVAPGVGIIFNFDREYYQQVQPAIVCIGRTASGTVRDPNVMLFEVLALQHSPAEVAEILQRRIVSYSIPEKEGSRIIKVIEQLEEGCQDILFIQCKRLHNAQAGLPSVTQHVASASESTGSEKGAEG